MIYKLGYKVTEIEILPIGANIKTNMNLNTNSKDLFLVSIAGIIMQGFLYIFMFFAFRFNLIREYTYLIFLKYNFFLLIFNLLPIYPLDGLKALSSLTELFLSFNTTILISYFISFVFLILFFFYNYYFELNNYLIIFFLLFKLILYIKEYKFILKKFYLERYLSFINYKKVTYIKKIKNIRKNRYNFINKESERKVLAKMFDLS